MEREIQRRPQLPILNKDIIDLLSDLCFKEDPITESDLIFAFGTNTAPKKLAKTIEYLLLEKFTKQVIITGGIANYNDSGLTNIAESKIIYELIDVNKFSDVKFYLEEESKNNLENVNNAKKIIDFTKIDSVICLSHSYASSRSVQSLRNVFNGRIQSFPYDIPSENKNILIRKNNWWKTELGKSLVWGEFLRFKKYGIRGDFSLTEEMKDIIRKVDLIII